MHIYDFTTDQTQYNLPGQIYVPGVVIGIEMGVPGIYGEIEEVK